MSKAAGGGTETVKVMVRVRPMNTKENQRGKLFPSHNSRLCVLCVSRSINESSIYNET